MLSLQNVQFVNTEFLCDKMGLMILASASSRRRKFLNSKLNGIDFDLVIAPISENEPGSEIGVKVSTQVEEICRFKANSAISEISKKIPINDIDLVLVSDTLLEDPDDSKIPIGKAVSKEDALVMLLRLSGKRHKVWSSSALLFPPGSKFQQIKDNEEWSVSYWTDYSIVEFEKLSDNRIIQLINGNSWENKAGSYDIMGEARKNLTLVEGDEVTVLGFSIRMIDTMMKIINQ